MSSAIHQVHDKFFRLSLGEPKVVTEFFTEHLPQDVLAKVNLATLKLENRSFIDENYKETEADVVYSAKIEGAAAYIYLLCEHQSTVDYGIAFRLWIYMTRLMEMHRKQYPGQPLPLVYPMVVYTGHESWLAPLDIFSLFGEHQVLAKSWLLQPFQLLNIQGLKDDDMRRRQWSGVVEFALKNKRVHDFKGFLKRLLPWLQELEQAGNSGFSLSKTVLKYVLDGTQAEGFEVFKKSVREHLSPMLGDEIMTLAQELEQRGMHKGMHKGIHLGIHQGEAAVLKRLLICRFKSDIPESYLVRIKQADTETLLQWSERTLDAKTLEEIFENN